MRAPSRGAAARARAARGGSSALRKNTRASRAMRPGKRVDTLFLRIIYKTRVVRECVSRDLGRRYYSTCPRLWIRWRQIVLSAVDVFASTLAFARLPVPLTPRPAPRRRPRRRNREWPACQSSQTETRQRKSPPPPFRPRRRLLALLPLELVLLRRFLRVLIPHVIRLIRRRFVLEADVAALVDRPRRDPRRRLLLGCLLLGASATGGGAGGVDFFPNENACAEARDSSRAPETTR